ncbi:MAG: ferric reductase-like transmembrane domain-containing protein [Streptosporangiaceae bacterium]
MKIFAGTTALWYASRATGIVALVLLTLVVLVGITVSRKGRVPGLPRFAVMGLHRRISLLAVAFVAVHVLTAIADPYVSIRLAAVIVPFASAYQPVQTGLGAVALDLGFAVLVTSLLRKRIGWRIWRAVHWLAYAAYPVAVLHGFTGAKDLRSGWLLVLTVVGLLAVAGAVTWRIAETRRYPGQRQRPGPLARPAPRERAGAPA